MGYARAAHATSDVEVAAPRRIHPQTRQDLGGACGPAAVLALQRQVGNGVVAAMLARRAVTGDRTGALGRAPAPVEVPVQRCGAEQHEGCPCTEAPADGAAIQRTAGAVSEGSAADDDVIAQPLSAMDRAAVRLRERIAVAPHPDLVLHLEHLEAAQAELQRMRTVATPQEQAQAVGHIRSAAVEHAPAFVGAQVAQDAPENPTVPAEAAGSAEATLARALVQRAAALAAAPLVAAGPPGWAILAGIAVVAAAVAVVYVATRDETTDITTDTTAEPRVEERPRSCATEYPGVRTCAGLPSQFVYPSPQAALTALKTRTGDPSLRLVNAAPSTSGPCPGVGMHYGVKSGGVYVASISCCPCCQDTPQGPLLQTRCRII